MTRQRLNPHEWLKYVTGEGALAAAILGPILADSRRRRAFVAWLEGRDFVACLEGRDSSPREQITSVFTSYALSDAFSAMFDAFSATEQERSLQERRILGIGTWLDGLQCSAQQRERLEELLLKKDKNKNRKCGERFSNQEFDLLLFVDQRVCWMCEFKVRGSKKSGSLCGDGQPGADLRHQLAKQVLAGFLLCRLVNVDSVSHMLVTDAKCDKKSIDIDVGAELCGNGYPKEAVDALGGQALTGGQPLTVHYRSWDDLLGFLRQCGDDCKAAAKLLDTNTSLRPPEPPAVEVGV